MQYTHLAGEHLGQQRAHVRRVFVQTRGATECGLGVRSPADLSVRKGGRAGGKAMMDVMDG